MGPDERLPYFVGLCEAAYSRRKWIVAMDVLPATTGVVGWLKRLGADSALVIAAARGVGEEPDPEFAPDPIVLGVEGEDMMSSIRRSLDAFANVGADVAARIDAFDPAGEARVIGAMFDDGRPTGMRQKYGARPQQWQALEDKTIVDALWDAAGVVRALSAVVPLDDEQALRESQARLDAGVGTVWAADMRSGFHGGASFVRRVRNEAEAEAARTGFAPCADRVRVMPYLEGIPCSIHGIVLPDFVAVLRPCEMIVFGRPDGTFLYGQVDTFWDPPDSDRAVMRDTARHVGRHLRETLGYRGAFTIDGVLTAEGFLPTELNPRFGAALNTQGRSVDLPLLLLNFAIVESEPFDWCGPELEALLLEAADRDRSGRTMAVVSRRITEAIPEVSLVVDGLHVRRAEDGEEPAATLVVGPHSAGGIVLVKFSEKQTPVGPSLAPRAAAVLAWADTEWNLGIGVLAPAVATRS